MKRIAITYLLLFPFFAFAQNKDSIMQVQYADALKKLQQQDHSAAVTIFSQLKGYCQLFIFFPVLYTCLGRLAGNKSFLLFNPVFV